MSKKNNIPFALRFTQWLFPKLETISPYLATRFFVKLFFTPLRYKMPEKEKEFLASAEKFNFQIEGKKIQGYSWGEGPVIWVMHGWAGRATQFRKFIPQLNQSGYKVVGIDGPSHGLSEGGQTNILEFDKALKQLARLKGEPVAVITHSFGGVALLYSIMQGLPVKRLVNIATPTIGEEIIKTYLKAVGGSASTGKSFRAFMIKTYGKPFEEFSALHFVKNLPHPVDMLLVYDDADEEVSLAHPTEFLNVYPARYVQTHGLGHNRILKDDQVIEQVLAFLKSEKPQ